MQVKFDELKLGMVLEQARRKEEFFEVIALDVDNKKVEIKSLQDGKQKKISKATLERWYKIKEGEFVENEEQPKEVAAEETQTSKATSEPANTEEPIKEEPKTVEPSEPTVEETVEEHKESVQEVVEPAEQPQSEDKEVVKDNAVKAEVQSALPTEEEKAATPKRRGVRKANPVLEKLRNDLVERIQKELPNVAFKETGSYTGLKCNKNFAEIDKGKTKKFSIGFIAEATPAEHEKDVFVYPKKYGWTINGKYDVFDESDLDVAFELIKSSYEYRLAHPTISRK